MGNVFLKLTITVLIPMFVGQLISFFFPNPVKKLREKVNFNLINQYSLLLFLYSTFCNTFAAEIPLVLLDSTTRERGLFLIHIFVLIRRSARSLGSSGSSSGCTSSIWPSRLVSLPFH